MESFHDPDGVEYEKRNLDVVVVFTLTRIVALFFFFQAEDGIRDLTVTGVSDVCSSDLTALTRFPTISRSRSRRTTSTSGNSGIVFLRSGRFGPCRDRVPVIARVRDLAEVTPGDPCRRLLRVLFRSAFARSTRLPAQHHGGEEALRVVRSFVAHLVARELVEGLGRQLLQPGLVVVPARAGRGLDDARLEQ